MPVLASMSLIALSYIWSQAVISNSTLIPVRPSKSFARTSWTKADGGVLSDTPRIVTPSYGLAASVQKSCAAAVPLTASAATGAISHRYLRMPHPFVSGAPRP